MIAATIAWQRQTEPEATDNAKKRRVAKIRGPLFGGYFLQGIRPYFGYPTQYQKRGNARWTLNLKTILWGSVDALTSAIAASRADLKLSATRSKDAGSRIWRLGMRGPEDL